MYKLVFGFSIFLLLDCSEHTQVNKRESNVAYVNITYMDIYTCYYIPLDPNTFNKEKDVTRKKITDKLICDSMSYYMSPTYIHTKAKYQDVVDPRISILLKYKDSTSKVIYIASIGEYMLDTVGIVYAKDEKFLKYVQTVINDDRVNWNP